MDNPSTYEDQKMSEPEDHLPQHLNDLWEDMDRLNAMYEELMWDHDVPLEFITDYKNNRIIIKPYDT